MTHPPADREAIRRALAAGLRTQHLGVLCRDEPGRFERASEHLSQAFMSFFALGDILFLTGNDVLPPLIATLGFLIFVIAIATKIDPSAGALSIVILWVGSALRQLFDGGLPALATTHLLPALVVLAVVAALRAAPFIRGVPLLLPVVLVVLFAPLLTSDFWEAANDLEVRGLFYVFCLSVLPFLLVLAPQLRRSARTAFVRAAETVDNDPEAAQEAAIQLEKVARESDPKLPEQSEVASLLDGFFTTDAVAREAPEIQERLSKTLERRLLFSLIPLTLGLGTCVTFYIYLVAWAMAPTKTVHSWLHQPIPHEMVPFIGAVPVGPYLRASVLLGIIAIAIFYAFVVTDEEKYASTLTDVVVRDPLRGAALFALPYSAVRREWGGPE